MTKRVLIVDDSSSMRKLVRYMLEQDDRLVVVGEADCAENARPMIKALNPDVLTLDIEMPGIGGIEFLRRLMRLRPMPVVMISSLTQAGSDFAIQALQLGAVDCVAKPGADRTHFPDDLAERVYQAAHVRHHPGQRAAAPAQIPTARFNWNGRVLLIGASTGGVEAIERVLSTFPADCPPTLITQHMPEGFLRSFAHRLNRAVRPAVALARDMEPFAQGHIYLAPGGQYHLEIARDRAGNAVCHLVEGEKCSGHRPSVDRLFHSAVPLAQDITALLLTGMGRDGADGMLGLRQAGAHTIAQDETTCIVYGMPRVAVSLNAAAEVLPLDMIADRALATCSSIAKAG